MSQPHPIYSQMNQQKVLFGTTNQAKIDHIRITTANWPVQILSPQDLGLTLDVVEDGHTAAENAVKKAEAYAAAANLPAFAIDAALTIERFPPEEQPGVYVRRIHREDVHVTDEMVIAHYRAALKACGGTTPAQWQIALALVSTTGQIQCKEYTIDTIFTDQPCAIQIPGAPLSSLMMDPKSGRYYAEMRYEERPDSLQLSEALAALFQQLAHLFNV